MKMGIRIGKDFTGNVNCLILEPTTTLTQKKTRKYQYRKSTRTVQNTHFLPPPTNNQEYDTKVAFGGIDNHILSVSLFHLVWNGFH